MPPDFSSRTNASSIGPSCVSTTCPSISAGISRGVSAASLASIHGRKKNWINEKGRSTRRKMVPDISTRIVKSLPASELKVMSPKPSVDIVTNVQ